MDHPQIATQDVDIGIPAGEIQSAGAAEPGEDLTQRIIRTVRLCWMKRRMFALILGGGVLLALVIAISLPAVYTSTTSVMPPDNGSSSSSLLSLLSTSVPGAAQGGALLGVKTPSALYDEILTSRTTQEALVKQFDLMHQYKSRFMDDACKRLAADTAIREDVKSGVVSISVKAHSPQLATNLAQAYVSELNRVLTDNSTSDARRERVFLEGRLKEVKKDLDDSSMALSKFASKSKTIDVTYQPRATLESELKLREEMIDARSELAGLEQTYSKDNVRVLTARARLAALQQQIDKANGGASAPGPNTRDSSYPSTGDFPALGVTYSDLDRNVRVDEQLWEALTKQYEESKVQEAKEIPTVRVLDVANLPERRSGPARIVIALFGAFLSFLAAVIAVKCTAVWEEIDPGDERKKLVRDIFGKTPSSQHRRSHLPGMIQNLKRPLN
jgi:uncharacterized protein involved in exopolysaccharide biosynthesis